jgi:hypothetical protein
MHLKPNAHAAHTKSRLDCCSFCVTRTIFLAKFIVTIHLQLNLDLGRPFSCLARHRATLPVAFSPEGSWFVPHLTIPASILKSSVAVNVVEAVRRPTGGCRGQ